MYTIVLDLPNIWLLNQLGSLLSLKEFVIIVPVNLLLVYILCLDIN